MEVEEYTQESSTLKKEYDGKQAALNKEFAMSRKLYQIGDIIENSVSKIKVARLNVGFSGFFPGTPVCVYHGPELTRKLKPRKDGNRKSIYQSDKSLKLIEKDTP